MPGPSWLPGVAELVTLPAGLVLILGGTSIAAAVFDPLGPSGALLYYGLFAVVAVANAVICSDVTRFVLRARRNRGPR